MNEGFGGEYFDKFINDIKINVNSIELMKSKDIKGKLLHTIVYSKTFNK